MQYMMGLMSGTSLRGIVTLINATVGSSANPLPAYMQMNASSGQPLLRGNLLFPRAALAGSVAYGVSFCINYNKTIVASRMGRTIRLQDAATAAVLGFFSSPVDIANDNGGLAAMKMNAEGTRLTLRLIASPFIATYDISNPNEPVSLDLPIAEVPTTAVKNFTWTRETPSRLAILYNQIAKKIQFFEQDLSLSVKQIAPADQPATVAEVTGVESDESFFVTIGNSTHYIQSYNLSNMSKNAAPTTVTTKVAVQNATVYEGKVLLGRVMNGFSVLVDLNLNQETWVSTNAEFYNGGLDSATDFLGAKLYKFRGGTSRAFDFDTQTVEVLGGTSSGGQSVAAIPNGNSRDSALPCFLLGSSVAVGVEEVAFAPAFSNSLCGNHKFNFLEFLSNRRINVVFSEDGDSLYVFITDAIQTTSGNRPCSIHKVDLLTGTIVQSLYDQKRFPAATFATAPNGVNAAMGFERDGWLFIGEYSSNSTGERLTRYDATTLEPDMAFAVTLDFGNVSIVPLGRDKYYFAGAATTNRILEYPTWGLVVQSLGNIQFQTEPNSDRIIHTPVGLRPRIYSDIDAFLSNPNAPLYDWATDLAVFTTTTPAFAQDGQEIVMGVMVTGAGRRYDAQTFAFIGFTGTGGNSGPPASRMDPSTGVHALEAKSYFASTTTFDRLCTTSIPVFALPFKGAASQYHEE